MLLKLRIKITQIRILIIQCLFVFFKLLAPEGQTNIGALIYSKPQWWTGVSWNSIYKQ